MIARLMIRLFLALIIGLAIALLVNERGGMSALIVLPVSLAVGILIGLS